MRERALEFRRAIERPLRYVVAGGPRGLATVRNLGQHILGVSREALSNPLDEGESRIFRSLQELFSHFDDLSSDEKNRCVERALALLGDSHPTPTKISFRPEEHPLPSSERLKEAQKALQANVQYVKGVGPALGQKLRGASIPTVRDLLFFFPHRYEDRRVVSRIRDLQEGAAATVLGTVEFSGVAFYRGLRRRVFEVTLEDGTGQLKLKWFHFLFGTLEQRIKRGQKLIVCGKVRRYRSTFEMHHPDYEVHGGPLDSASFGRIVPVYREVGGIYQRTLRRILGAALGKYGSEALCALPPEICEREDLLPPWRAIRELHLPQALRAADRPGRSEAERSLSFEELFFYCLSLALRKRQLAQREGIAFDGPAPRCEKLLRALPFELTDAQKKVWQSVREDMRASKPMNRLLQGDVGSGKTVLAFLASLVAIDHGRQAAVMAPTEILAEQHLRTMSSWAEATGIRIALLLGRHPEGTRRKILTQVEAGEIDLLIGTHALLEGDVKFRSLGFVVVDEQHRFGVRQRATLRSKAAEPDVLVMSATPIPRTLALTLYGDLDVSLLNQLPKGRQPIDTRLFAERERGKVYQLIREELSKGRQAFIVYPLVSESEHLDAKDATSMAQELQEKVFPDFRVGLVHGQMAGAEKDLRMSEFSGGKTHVLVSTTVVEVGIDIPNATVMLIEHPERFGLSQLHQLRGRVGRGSEKAYCFLIRPAGASKMARQRLETFASIHDGFLLAEEDLRLRGPGDFFGVEQSGLPSFRVAVFPRDLDVLERARREAFDLLERDPELRERGHQHLSWLLGAIWSERLSLVRVG